MHPQCSHDRSRVCLDGQYDTRYCRLCYLYDFDPSYHLFVDIQRSKSVPLPKVGLGTKLVNLAHSMIQHARAGFPESTPEEAQRRMELCLVCDHFDSAAVTCGKCGCKMHIKVTWGEQKCPIGKW